MISSITFDGCARHALLAGVLGLALCTGAQAQVVRCTDAVSGKVTYTDGSCQRGAEVHEVEARKTAEEIRQQRERAAQAERQKQQRLDAEAAADERASRSAAASGPPPRPASASASYSRTPECARARRNLDMVIGGGDAGTYEQTQRVDAAQRQVHMDCLGPEAYADLEKDLASRPVALPAPVIVLPPRHARPVPRPPRGTITHCNVFRCHDNRGNVYPR